MKSRFCFQVMLLAVLLSSPVVAQVDSARYGEFKDRKAAVDTEIASQVTAMEQQFTVDSAPLVAKKAEEQLRLDQTTRQWNDMTRAGFENKVFNIILDIVKSKVSIPFFYLTIILALAYLFFLKRALFMRHRILISVIAGILLVLYSVDLFAQDNSSRRLIDSKITTVNRLLNAGEIDKAIVSIEETSETFIEMSLPDVSSTWLIPVESFRKGSFTEKYTLGCLYYENKDFNKVTELFSGALSLLKPTKGELDQVVAMLKYFEEIKDPVNALLAIGKASAIGPEQGDLLAHLDTAGLGPEELRATLEMLLSRMRGAVDFLKAAVYLNSHGDPARASEMYARAVRTARDSAGYLGLADYAYNNGLPAEAAGAMDKAFKSARTTEAFLAYFKLATKHQIPNAPEAWDRAVASARSIADFVLVSRYLKEQDKLSDAIAYLKMSVDKKGTLKDLLDVMNLAAEMNSAALVEQIVDSVLARTRRFEDFMKIAGVCNQVAPGKLPQVFSSAVASAYKLSHFRALAGFVVGASDKGLISVVVSGAVQKIGGARDLLTLRKELMEKGFKDAVGPLNMAVVNRLRFHNELMSLFNMFEAEGFRDAAEMALARIVAVSSKQNVIENIMNMALEREYFSAAFDGCLRLLPSRDSTNVPDPRLIPEASLVPNGPEIEYGVFCAVIGHKAGRSADALAVLETRVAGFLEAYINDPDSVIAGPVNTYFYLRLLWELSGVSSMVPRYEQIYKVVETRYLEEYKAEKSEAISEKQIELENRRIALNQEIAAIQAETEETAQKIEAFREEHRKQVFKKIASFMRVSATVGLFIVGIVIAAIAGWRFSRKLTRFRISGFTFKFFETFGFELMFTIILLPVGLVMLVVSQVSMMVQHIQQDAEEEMLCDRVKGYDPE
ncbi:MAG TPA: hypothetical protein PLB35_11490 [Myxococcota bacterium]|nr:hypothetical protein [Myxococcota bacterium]HOH77867.1 hypothetical protein [Myxococcota bacterium]HPV04368.1 hypothetical protein [Myxococcota bacterium]